ncbi:hypothetical protein [Syntrophotalea carbinolica]|nr:hypothetical protein [Syntrophotalea carbinolica]
MRSIRKQVDVEAEAENENREQIVVNSQANSAFVAQKFTEIRIDLPI